MNHAARSVHAESALLPTGWATQVQIDIDANGLIKAVKPNAGTKAKGCLLPGIANLHSHAHQRAMAGFSERASPQQQDNFWTWRDTMYRFVAAIEPPHLYAIAAQLYVEMLKAGYTHLAEFQYLHHQRGGRPYDTNAEMSLQTLAAATSVGIGITNLPVLYQYGGFGKQALNQQQKRFANNIESYLDILNQLIKASEDKPNAHTGLAAHSLRAVDIRSFKNVLEISPIDMPVHIHIAEQQQEVDDCLSVHGMSPVEYLLQHFDVDSRWCLVHATHMNTLENLSLAQSGAVAGLCPTTEANLGDGLFNAVDYLAQHGRIGIGSDSHISVSPVEELRWLEYGQRLTHQQRNVISDAPQRSTGRTLFELATQGGAQACGYQGGAIAVGNRADFIVLDTNDPLLCERQGDTIIDSWIFSGNRNAVCDVYVGGERVIQDGQHARQTEIQQAFQSTIKELSGRL